MMNKSQIVAFVLLFSVMLNVHAEASYEPFFVKWLLDFSRTKGVEPVNNELYKEECGACHFPYQPGWLPEQSWKKLVSAQQLEDHFGDSAELDEEDRLKIEHYLVSHSADKSWYKRSRKIMASLEDGVFPLRITQTPYIRDKHSEIPKKQIVDNEKVMSLSYCNNCHQQADEGVFDDDTVVIPGYSHSFWF